MNTNSSPYIYYHDDKQLSSLDQNTVNYTKFDARHPYSKENTFFLMQPYITTPRDLSNEYFYDSEKLYHPPHFSHFAYNNGLFYPYGSGTQVALYATSGWCCEDLQPQNTAPERFYERPTRQCQTITQSRIDYDKMK